MSDREFRTQKAQPPAAGLPPLPPPSVGGESVIPRGVGGDSVDSTGPDPSAPPIPHEDRDLVVSNQALDPALTWPSAGNAAPAWRSYRYSMPGL